MGLLYDITLPPKNIFPIFRIVKRKFEVKIFDFKFCAF